MKGLYITILGVVQVALGLIVLMELWEWFAVPLFHLEPLGWLSAWGLTLLVGVLKGGTSFFNFESEIDPDMYMRYLGVTIGDYCVVYCLGYLIHINM